MNRFKRVSYLREFPWLHDLKPWKDVQVKRLDEVVLRHLEPVVEIHTGSMVDIHIEDEVHFVLNSGKIMKNVVHQRFEWRSNYIHEEPVDKPGETILEAIDRLGVADVIRYVVLQEQGHEYVSGQYDREVALITIYKLPRGKTLGEFVEKARRDAEKEVAREISF